MENQAIDLYRGEQSIFKGDFFLVIGKHNYYWYCWDDEWSLWSEDLPECRLSSPLEFLIVTGKSIENQLV